MQRFVLSVLMLLSSYGLLAQSQDFLDSKASMEDAIDRNYYTVLDKGTGTINNNTCMYFEVYNWSAGSYSAGVIVDDCWGCQVELRFENFNTGNIKVITPTMEFYGGTAVARYPFNQTNEGRGKLWVCMRDNKNQYIYATLVKR